MRTSIEMECVAKRILIENLCGGLQRNISSLPSKEKRTVELKSYSNKSKSWVCEILVDNIVCVKAEYVTHKGMSSVEAENACLDMILREAFFSGIMNLYNNSTSGKFKRLWEI